MKRRFSSFVLLLAFVFSVSEQKAQVAKGDPLQSNLRKHIEYLASDQLKGRRTGEAGATAAAGYVANQFAKLKLRAGVGANGKANYLQPFPYAKTATQPSVTGYNVIGILDGTDKELKKEAIVIGAHYDHLGSGGDGSLAANSKEVHHGADDNASGTAAIIELARQFATEKKNKRTIIFIAFSGEEEGLFGSKFYINNPSFPIENTVAMINLDMVGRLSTDKLTIGGIGTASEWKALIEAKNFGGFSAPAILVPTKIFELGLNEDGFGPSDHSSFYTKKIPVLFFFTGTHLDYHKPSDTADKINYEGEAKVIYYVASIVKAVDVNPVKPTYAVAKSSAAMGGRTSFSVSLGTIPSYTDSGDGLTIDGARDNSPASKAGLKGGDKIVKLAGKEVKNIQDYMAAMGTMKAGDEYEVVVKRGSEMLTLTIIPAPAAPRP
jgi:aminopeptidase YwaD